MTEQRRVLSFFLAKFWKHCVALFASSLLGVLLDVCGVFSVLPFLSILLGSKDFARALGVPGKLLAAAVARVPGQEPLLTLCLLVLSFAALQYLAKIAASYLTAKALAAIRCEAQNEVMAKYAKAPYDYFVNRKHATLFYTTSISTFHLAAAIPKIPQMVVEIIRVCGLSLLLLWLDFRVALGLIVVGVVFDRVVGRFWTRFAYDLGGEMRQAELRMRTTLLDFFGGIKDMMAFDVRAAWAESFQQTSRDYAKLFLMTRMLQDLPRPMIELGAIVAVFGAILSLRWLHADVALSLPLLGTVAAGAARLLPSISTITRLRTELSSSVPELENVYAAMTQSFEEKAPRARLPPRVSSLRLEDVGFAYPGRERLLDGLGAEIPLRRVTLLTGAAGSGKTTLLNLLLRLYRPTSGRVAVDGLDLWDIEPRSWNGRLGVVSQRPFFFHASVDDNISFGRSCSRRQAREAARLVGAEAFIEGLPQGFETLIGDRGMKLSGGQQQLIALARAVAGEPELLILDEPMTALDKELEAVVQSAIKSASEGRTTIVAAHRPLEHLAADQIIELRGGGAIVRGVPA